MVGSELRPGIGDEPMGGRGALRRLRLAPAANPRVERLGREVCAVGPHDRAEFLVHNDRAEVSRITKRLEDSSPVPRGEVDLALRSVLKRQPELVVADDLDRGDMNQLRHRIHATAGVGSAPAAPRCVPFAS
jgi:hypothetical protein